MTVKQTEAKGCAGMTKLATAFNDRIAAAPSALWRRGAAWLIAASLCLMASILSAAPARALEEIGIAPDQERIDLSVLAEIYPGRGDRFSVETAAGADGVGGRLAVTAKTPGTNPT